MNKNSAPCLSSFAGRGFTGRRQRFFPTPPPEESVLPPFFLIFKEQKMKDVFIELDDCPSSPSELLWELAEARRQVARLEKELAELRGITSGSPLTSLPPHPSLSHKGRG
jgi:hypothetical protein